VSLTTVEFGPVRAIGLRYEGKNENEEIMRLWGSLLPRRGEIATPEGGGAFGVCRCLPGVKDGSFEYLAGFGAREDARVPDGMTALEIPRGEYVVHRVERVDDYKQVWMEACNALAVDPELASCCNGPDDCQCAAHPAFEYYPPEFHGNGPVHIYLAVRRK